jgi:hypothetical protein
MQNPSTAKRKKEKKSKQNKTQKMLKIAITISFILLFLMQIMKEFVKASTVAHVYNPSALKAEQEDLDFKASLCYAVSVRTA